MFLIGHIYKQADMYFEYLGNDTFIVYRDNFNPRKKDLLILRGLILPYAVEISKDDKDFLKIKEEVINKIKTHTNGSYFSRINEYIKQLDKYRK